MSQRSVIVKKLLEWKKGDEDNPLFERAVKGLVKKLRNNGGLEELEKAITSEGQTPSSCVTIPRTLDGRMQVKNRKVLPHIIYCQLWRWPNIQSHHEIRAIEDCQFAFNLKREDVCINPYHYKRVETPAMPPIMVPKQGKETSTPAPVKEEPSQTKKFQTPLNRNIDGDAPFDNLIPSESTQDEFDLSSIMRLDLAKLDNIPPPNNNEEYTSPPNSQIVPEGFDAVSYEEPEAWCSILYNELRCRTGDTFHCTKPIVTVDGYTDPSSQNRFCLGLLSNINRTEMIEESRKHIGKGVRLFYVGGIVTAECLSSSAIFIQSSNCNRRFGWHPATVCKVPPGCYLEIFNNQEFAKLLAESVHLGFNHVYQLKSMCMIRLSFVKGWGADYKRQTVTSTPCWIEIRLNGPLKWLDKVLVQMGSSSGKISSTT